jgi:acetyl esterase
MPVDPQIQALLDKGTGVPATHTLLVDVARAQYEARIALMAPAADIASVRDRTIDGPGGPLRIRIYTPQGTGPFPLLVFFHGSGFVLCSLDTHDGMCRNLAAGIGCVVVSVDYRLAPEHRYPAAADDCYAATQWCAAHAAELGVDAARIAIGGDSAGGNLAASVSIWARDNGGPKLQLQLLAYPVTDAVARAESYRRYEDGYGLNAATMEWFFDHYAPDKGARGDWRVSPLRAASLAGLPPALVVTAGYDPLRDEGRAYAFRLQQEGTLADLVEFGGMLHGFLSSPMLLHGARRGTTLCAAALREALVLRAQ